MREIKCIYYTENALTKCFDLQYATEQNDNLTTKLILHLNRLAQALVTGNINEKIEYIYRFENKINGNRANRSFISSRMEHILEDKRCIKTGFVGSMTRIIKNLTKQLLEKLKAKGVISHKTKLYGVEMQTNIVQGRHIPKIFYCHMYFADN